MFDTPEWIKKANVYHIYPLGAFGCERYRHDLKEDHQPHRILTMLEWIDHLKAMNISAVYFGPLFESVAHGYDTTDYKKIDERLGTNDDFTKVCDALHENGIRIILDGVFNHVGREHFAFKDVQSNRERSGYCSWFCNLNFGGNTGFNDGFWYEGWNNNYDLVKLNLRNPGVVEYLLDAVNYWIEQWKIDGIRFDAADCLDKDFIKRIHDFTRGKKRDFWLMGEIIHGNYSMWANPDMFDCVTNYQCYKGIYSSHNDRNYFEIAHSIEYQMGQYGDIYMYNFLDNHDVARLASQLTDYNRIYCCYTLLYTMYGVPSVYYGSEYGIKGAKGRGADADFALRPQLDLNNIPDKDDKLFAHICKLGAIRADTPALQAGKYSKIDLKNQTFLYKREEGGQAVYIALNISDGDYTFSVPTHYQKLVDRLSGTCFAVNNGWASVAVGKNQSVILADADSVPDGCVEKAVADSAPDKREAVADADIAPDKREAAADADIAPDKREAAANAGIAPDKREVPAESGSGAEKIEPGSTVKASAVKVDNSAKIEEAAVPQKRKSYGIPDGRMLVIGGRYRHFKGGEYIVTGTASDHETLEPMCIYLQINDKPRAWVRPISEFLDDIDDNGNRKARFEFIERAY